jgi:replicative DNA helicase
MTISKSVTRYQPTAEPVASPHTEELKTQEPLDAYGGVVAFLDLISHLEGRSINTHIERIDSAIGGLERQTLMVLAARPSMGKSTLAWQIARNVAAFGQKALFFSLEMSITSLWAKAACGAVGTSWRDIRAGKASEATITKVIDSATELMEVYQDRLLVNDHVNMTRNIWESVEIHRPDLVIVDHLRLINDRNENEVQRLGAITKNLKDLAKEMNIAVLCLAQLNRQVEQRDQKRPQMADLRDSGQIEENADTILMLYRPDYYDDNQTYKPVSETEILIRKFRDDINNQRIKLYFDTRHQWFHSELP